MGTGVTRSGRLRVSSMLGALALLAGLLLPLTLAAPARAATSDWSPPSTVYISQTGHSIDGVFLDFWRNNDGIDNYGDPITAETQLHGHTVQYYEYARFEYWPDDPNGNVVHLGNIGEELRPKSVVRSSLNMLVSVGTKKDSANREMAAFSQSWMPVDKTIAKKPATDSWTYVAATGHTVQNGFKTWWDNSGQDSYLGNPVTEEYTLKGTTYQVFERGQLAWTQGSDPWLVPLGGQLAKTYGVSTDATAQGDLPEYSEDLFVPPAPTTPDSTGYGPMYPGERFVEVSLGQQYLWAHEGNNIVLETYVSTGREGFETPEGTFYINSKLLSQTMEGVIGGEYYNVPDVPWVMYFTDEGHALHGTYWHSNFGTPMSHGCVNLPMDVAEWMYGWADVGTRVVIHD